MLKLVYYHQDNECCKGVFNSVPIPNEDGTPILIMVDTLLKYNGSNIILLNIIISGPINNIYSIQLIVYCFSGNVVQFAQYYV